jgi:hypothetical protein
VLALELLSEVGHESVIEIFTSQVSITSGGLDFEDTILNGQKRHIECTTSQIEDENVLFASSLDIKIQNRKKC